MDAVVVSWARRHFLRQQWTHQQDSAQAHRAKAMQKWYKAHFSADFITPAEWRPTRLISTQSYLVNFEYKNLEALEQSLQRGGEGAIVGGRVAEHGLEFSAAFYTVY